MAAFRHRGVGAVDLHLPFRLAQPCSTTARRAPAADDHRALAEWNVTAARDRAKALRRDVDGGLDPLSLRGEVREAPRFPDLVNRYLREHAAHLAPRNAADQESMLKKLIEPHWKHRLVAEIEPADVARMLNLIAEGRSRQPKETQNQTRKHPRRSPRARPQCANRAGEMLRKVFNLGSQRMRPDNPAISFRRRVRTERERFLLDGGDRAAEGGAGQGRGSALARRHHHMCMLTGARLGEVRTARFEAFRSGARCMGKARRQYQSSAAPIGSRFQPTQRALVRAAVRRSGQLQLAVSRRRRGQGSARCRKIRRFWGDSGSGRLARRASMICATLSPRLGWSAAGPSLEMIGKLLGHFAIQHHHALCASDGFRCAPASMRVADLMRIRPRLVHFRHPGREITPPACSKRGSG